MALEGVVLVIVEDPIVGEEVPDEALLVEMHHRDVLPTFVLIDSTSGGRDAVGVLRRLGYRVMRVLLEVERVVIAVGSAWLQGHRPVRHLLGPSQAVANTPLHSEWGRLPRGSATAVLFVAVNLGYAPLLRLDRLLAAEPFLSESARVRRVDFL